MTETLTVHPFEVRGLGVAPFVCTSIDDAGRVAGGCDYCGTGIRFMCRIVDATGKRFKVGTDCVAKLARTDNRLTTIAAQAAEFKREVERQAREEKRTAAWARACALRDGCVATLRANPAALAEVAHPYGRTGESLRTWAEWCLVPANGGMRSWAAVASALRAHGFEVVPATREDRARTEAERVAREEAEALAEQERADARKRANRERFRAIVEVLVDGQGDFRDSVARSIEFDGIASLSPRALSIVRDIFGKAYGRRGSNAYEAAVERFDALVEAE